ncbi:11665_t:CDS:2, partial [Diversispora eburnea]
ASEIVNNDIVQKDYFNFTQLELELIQFFMALRRKDKQPYASTSTYNCYCAIAHYLRDNSLMRLSVLAQ